MATTIACVHAHGCGHFFVTKSCEPCADGPMLGMGMLASVCGVNARHCMLAHTLTHIDMPDFASFLGCYPLLFANPVMHGQVVWHELVINEHMHTYQDVSRIWQPFICVWLCVRLSTAMPFWNSHTSTLQPSDAYAPFVR